MINPLLDGLTTVLLVLSTLLFVIITRYSKRYMMGDPGRQRFSFWLYLTGACVIGLVLAQNLLLFALAWLGISLSLHQLLQFYSNRPGALLAARKKFLISRLGDGALLAALILVYREFGTWQFQPIFNAAAQLKAAGLERLPLNISWICALLVFAALLKSAQFPFHSWLPDTMETPTPVSALMHAGIINAGGILIIRLSPLVSLSGAALDALAMVGGFTALFASVVMLTQASVKRNLAFSTVAQMGFMMLECGLGAFHLALLHLVAHSLYKAHAFLSAGGAVQAAPQPHKRSVTPVAMGIGLICALGIFAATAWMLHADPLDQPVLNGIFVLALAQLIWSASDRPSSAVVLGAVLSFAYLLLEGAAAYIVTPLPRETGWLAVPLLALFLVIALAQAQLPRLSRSVLGTHLYIHARNGFYLNTLANRLTTALWPAAIARREI